ncbi:MAG: hypothetical protein JOY79_05625, partial [Acidobacteriaceae bacterium]|nr:hypothetical protein [Acidobacteriaceae bacterium]
MKRTVLVLLLASAAMAQDSGVASHSGGPRDTAVRSRPQTPTYSDVNCSGFLSEDPVAKQAEVIGSRETPQQTRFVSGNYVYLTGSNFKVGDAYSIVRQVHDPNRYEMFRGQHAMLNRTGKMYADIGRLRVVQVEGHTAITEVEYSCDTALPGDTAIAYVERPMVQFRSASTFERFAPPNGKLTAKIVMAKDFDNQIAEGNKVYLNVGSQQGVKTGDYFRVVRTYEYARSIEVDGISYHGTADVENGIDPGHVASAHIKELPRISIGELVVLSVTKRTATAMITTSLQDIHLGDVIELEDGTDSSAGASGSAKLQPVSMDSATSASKNGKGGPTVFCMTAPATVRSGEGSTITCEAASPEG